MKKCNEILGNVMMFMNDHQKGVAFVANAIGFGIGINAVDWYVNQKEKKSKSKSNYPFEQSIGVIFDPIPAFDNEQNIQDLISDDIFKTKGEN